MVAESFSETLIFTYRCKYRRISDCNFRTINYSEVFCFPLSPQLGTWKGIRLGALF